MPASSGSRTIELDKDLTALCDGQEFWKTIRRQLPRYRCDRVQSKPESADLTSAR